MAFYSAAVALLLGLGVAVFLHYHIGISLTTFWLLIVLFFYLLIAALLTVMLVLFNNGCQNSESLIYYRLAGGQANSTRGYAFNFYLYNTSASDSRDLLKKADIVDIDKIETDVNGTIKTTGDDLKASYTLKVRSLSVLEYIDDQVSWCLPLARQSPPISAGVKLAAQKAVPECPLSP